MAIDVLLTRRIEHLAKPADLESVIWWECPSQAQDMAEDPTGSRFIV